MKKKYAEQKKFDTKKALYFLKKYYVGIIFFILFAINIFLQFYQLSERAHWGWDQVDVAWNVKKILLDRDYPIFGMVAKGNTGFHIGPAYYYLAAAFYKLTDLHPIASPILAALSAMISFLVLYFVSRRIFSDHVALIAIAISTFSSYILQFDKIQWPVNFIAPLSILIFYSLYKILTGSPKYYYLLFTMLGISLNIHFTSVFYFVAILLVVPFLPRNKNAFLTALFALPLFIIWILPNILFVSGNNSNFIIADYLQANYHGIHLQRILQLTHDAFIEFQGILFFEQLSIVSFIFLPLFLFVYLYKKVSQKKLLLCYLIILWFLIPWLAFSTYIGEISNYYFTMTRPIALMILAFLTYRAIKYKWYLAGAIIGFWVLFVVLNLKLYFKNPENEFGKKISLAEERIKKGDPIELHKNVPEAYWHWYMKSYKKVTSN